MHREVRQSRGDVPGAWLEDIGSSDHRPLTSQGPGGAPAVNIVAPLISVSGNRSGQRTSSHETMPSKQTLRFPATALNTNSGRLQLVVSS